MKAAEEASRLVGVQAACQALGVARATLYRARLRVESSGEPKPRPAPPRALSQEERKEVLDELHSERFIDKAPAEVYATLLDEGRHLCSIRTMYRILDANKEVKERRGVRKHPHYVKPELVATGPNQVWTWDITKIAGPKKWNHFHLYVVIDIFSRYVVAWRLERTETGALAKELLEDAMTKQGVDHPALTIHADRGTSMSSKTVAQLFADLGVTKSHSRPRVSNDNPYSESHFKTFKYRPDFPSRFGSLADGRGHCRRFVYWYNEEHYHSGIALLTPAQVHYGQADEIIDGRHEALLRAHVANPERFVHGRPKRPALPKTVWINEPQALDIAASTADAVGKLGAGSAVGNPAFDVLGVFPSAESCPRLLHGPTTSADARTGHTEVTERQ